MRIEKLILKNYRQFRSAEMSFRRAASEELYVIVGKNGSGKTNILNSIDWCLYGEEPHLALESKALPIINMKVLHEAEDGQTVDVVSELWVTTDNDETLVFTRRLPHNIFKNGGSNDFTAIDPSFEVRIIDEKGEAEFLEDEAADAMVSRFIPENISGFFLFNGERLDHYFQDITAQQIRHSIFEISQIDLLLRMQNHLITVRNSYEKEAGKSNPLVGKVIGKLEKVADDLDEIEGRISKCEEQATIAKMKIQDYEKLLRGIPDVKDLEEERTRLRSEIDNKKALLATKIKSKNEVVFNAYKVLSLWPAIKLLRDQIKEMREKDELPPTIDKSLLEDIITNGICKICGRPLDKEAEELVHEALSKVKWSSDIIRQMMENEMVLQEFKQKVHGFESTIDSLNGDIRALNNDIESNGEKIEDINKKLMGYDIEKIKTMHLERQNYERIQEECWTQIGCFRTEREKLTKERDALTEEKDKELAKETKYHEIQEKIDLCEKAIKAVAKSKEEIMTETRKQIEDETKKLFFSLLWKKGTIKDVAIDELYNISVTHMYGHECLGSLSAAETELLALSFTLAVQKVSGFNSPLLIDTPVARTADEHRENLAEVFTEVGRNKQLILLFTSAEYSKELSVPLDKDCVMKYQIKMNEQETEAEVRVMKDVS